MGIGQQLDALEAEFTEDDRESLASDAVNQLFPDYNSLLNGSSSAMAQAAGPVRSLLELVRDEKFEAAEDRQVAINSMLEDEQAKLEKELLHQLQTEVDAYISSLNIKLADTLITGRQKYDRASTELANRRRRRYINTAVFTAAIYELGLYISHHRSQRGPTSALGQAVFNLLCGLAVEVVVLGIVKIKTNIPKLLEKAHEDIQAELNTEVRQLFENATKDVQFEAANEATIANRLNVIYTRSLDLAVDTWKDKAGTYLDSLRHLYQNYASLRGEHGRRIDKLRAGSLRYFSDSAGNMAVLSNVAMRIKESAIEPSFSLLDTTKEQLASVKADVLAVQFD